jgi:4-hydroxybenzoate polyprenyltransferase
LFQIRQIAKNFLDFIGFSNLFLAVAVFCSTLQGGFIFKHANEPAIAFSILNFVAAFFLYNLQRIFQSTQPTTDTRLLWYRKNKKWIFTFAVLFGTILFEPLWNTFILYKEGILIYGACAFFSILYFLPPVNLRKTAGLKQFYIALIWVMVCIVIPFMFEEASFSGSRNFQKDQWLYIISQFCFIAALCIPFDIRDVEKDKLERTKSLPVTVGVKNSKYIGIGLMLIYFILSFFIETKSLIGVRGIVFIASSVMIWFSEPHRHRYYFTYLADGMIILQTILLYTLL